MRGRCSADGSSNQNLHGWDFEPREEKRKHILQQAHTTRKKDLQQGRELEGAAAVKPESEAKKKGETAKDKGATPEKTQRKADASGISSDGAAAAVTEAKAPPSPTSDANRPIVNTGLTLLPTRSLSEGAKKTMDKKWWG